MVDFNCLENAAEFQRLITYHLERANATITALRAHYDRTSGGDAAYACDECTARLAMLVTVAEGILRDKMNVACVEKPVWPNAKAEADWRQND